MDPHKCVFDFLQWATVLGAAAGGAVEQLEPLTVCGPSEEDGQLFTGSCFFHQFLTDKKGPVTMATGRLVEVYLDLMSQPCRAVHILLNCAKIAHRVRTVALRKGETATPTVGLDN